MNLPTAVMAAQLPLPDAWRRVRAKAGMPGADGVAVSQFSREADASIRTLEQQMASGAYRPMPLRLVAWEKKNRGLRVLLVPAVRDRIAQAAVAAWLGVRWNDGFDKASYAYRPGLGVRSALRYLRELYRAGYRWVFDADIRSCFDSIQHDKLFTKVSASLGDRSPVTRWITQWIEADVWDGADLTRLDYGIPQGSPLSPLLANFFLDGFDRTLRRHDVKFVRYADDFLVLAKTPFDIGGARAVAESALADLGLSLNPAKTRTTSFDQWFSFLGARIQGDEILLPFERLKTPLSPVYVAPRMPPVLLRAWKEGRLSTCGPFDASRSVPRAPEMSSKPVPTQPTLASLRTGQ